MISNIYPAGGRRSDLMRRILVLAALTLGPSSLSGQAAQGDSLWAAGRRSEARAAYERALASDSASAPALYRLALLASWRNDLDSAGALARRARAADPLNADVQMLQARLAAWRGSFDEAVAIYDSVVVRHHDRADAHLELARTLYWRGDLARASRTIARASELDGSNADVRVLDARLRRATRAAIEIGAGWHTDSDENTSWWQTIAAVAPLSDRTRHISRAGAQQSTDPIREGSRLLGELGLVSSIGRATVNVAGGARRLAPEGGDSRTEPTYRGGIHVRSRSVSAGISFAHLPFDETARLIGSALDLDVVDGEAEMTLRPGLLLQLGGGAAWISDGNDRYNVTASLSQTVAQRFFVGTYGRQMGYEFQGVGYFSPDRFRLAEVRAGWSGTTRWWDGRVTGGVGVQQAFEGADLQGEWHVDARVGRRWVGGVIEAFGSVTNSLERSTTGAYRSGAVGVQVVVGL